MIKNRKKYYADGISRGIINYETGEIEHDFTNAVLYEESDCEVIPNWQGGKSFVKLYEKAAARLGNDFPAIESQMCMRLVEYVSYEDNIIRKNGKCMTIQDLADTFGYGYEPMRRIVKSM